MLNSINVQSPFSELTESKVNYLNTQFNSNEIQALEILIDNIIKSGNVKLKKLLRKLNLPAVHPIRKTLWSRILSRNPTLNSVLSDVPDFNDQVFSSSPFEKSSSSSLIGYEFSDQLLLPKYNLSLSGLNCLKTILHHIFISRPELVYAPQLWPIGALLLHYLDPSMTYACLIMLLDKFGFIIQTKLAWKEFCLSLEQIAYLRNLLKEPKSSHQPPQQQIMNNQLGNSNDSNSQYAYKLNLARWNFTLWSLPFDYLICIMDSFLIEGPKVFYRAGLILLKLAVSLQKQFKPLDKANPYDFLNSIDLNRIATNPSIDPDKFKEKMFRLLNLSRTHISQSIRRIQSIKNSYFDYEVELIKPCKFHGQLTFAPYLLDQSQSTYVHPSECITSNELATIITSIPDNKISQLSKPCLIFSTNTDGCSLRAFYNKAASIENPSTLILVRSSSKQSIIGAFCSDRWEPRTESSYFGTGHCFLFRIKPEPIVIYPWIGYKITNHENQYSSNSKSNFYQRFQRATLESIEIGGSESTGFPGLCLDQLLKICSTGPSPTFGNPCLVTESIENNNERTTNGCIFNVGLVELIGFKDL